MSFLDFDFGGNYDVPDLGQGSFPMGGEFGGGFDFGNFDLPNFGQFDLGPEAFQLPDFTLAGPMGAGFEEAFPGASFDVGPYAAGFEEAYPGASQSPFAGGEENLAYDTTPGVVVDRTSGREVTPFQSGGRMGTDITGRVQGMAGLVPRGQGPGDGVFAGAERFLNTGLGRLLAAGGIGALGLGAQRAIAGSPPTYRPPTFTPSAATQTREAMLMRALEANAGPQAAIRAQALGLIPGQLTPGQEQPFADPIRAALQRELLNVLSGGGTGVSPQTQERQRREEDAFRIQMARQLGRDWELSTEGAAALNTLKQRFTQEQFAERQATIARLSPLEEGRMRFEAGFPTEQLGAREGLRRANVGQLAGFGEYGIPQINPDAANLVNFNLAAQGGLENYRAQTQSQRDLAAGVGGIAGTLAGQVGQRPSRLEDLIASNYGFARTPSDFRFL